MLLEHKERKKTEKERESKCQPEGPLRAGLGGQGQLLMGTGNASQAAKQAWSGCQQAGWPATHPPSPPAGSEQPPGKDPRRARQESEKRAEPAPLFPQAAAPEAPYNLLINAVPKQSTASHFRPFKDTAHVLSRDGTESQGEGG